MNIAVIPARGGSKRIPRKNIRDFAGKPMISYAIAAALASHMFERVIVSTDDQEIAAIAQQHGAAVPFIRPADLADDHTPTVPVIAHAVLASRQLGWQVDYACCIYPAVPFIEVEDLHRSFSLLTNTGADYSFPVTEFPSAIQRAMRLLCDSRMVPMFPEYELTRTQDLDPTYFDVGQFYWASAESWLTCPRIHSNGVGHPIPNWRVVDIDTPDDWARAELLFRIIKQIGKS
jgi:pseudaminic acid cytidylyltransferase